MLVNKIRCYHDYYRSGGMAARLRLPRSDYKQAPFRALLICKTRERLENIAIRLLSSTPPIRTLVWLAVINDVLESPMSRIWNRPADFAVGLRMDNPSFGTGENRSLRTATPSANRPRAGSNPQRLCRW
jgi:hypothetical protein